MVSIRLLEQEQEYMLENSFPITTISFYSTTTLQSCLTAGQQLRIRFDEILAANPWLCGRLVKEKGGRQVSLSFDTPIKNPQDYSSFTIDDHLFQLSDWRSIWDHVWSYIPKLGIECVDKDEQLCRLVVFRSTRGDQLALLFSLNHTIGDGCTFYRLWKMFDSREEARPMEVQRAHSIQNLYDPELNSKNSGMWIHKMIEIAKVSYKGKPRKKKRKIFMRKLCNESMRKAKEKYKTGESYVSTNDVLCSWLFAGCKNHSSMNMTVNMRGRTAELTDNMAGNYIIACPLQVSESPRDFRAKWSSVLKGQQPHDKVEGDNWSANWLPLFHQVEINGCEHLLHLPVFQWTDLQDLVSEMTDCFMYVFRLNARDVGVVIGLNENCFDRDFVNKCDLLETPGALGRLRTGYFLRERTRDKPR